ncbi:MAG: hypothetical protein NVV73_19815 [Cellvibrionaceae bacterium]|nr:hypothetical protein [Cellvibrionaceae bacterium]
MPKPMMALDGTAKVPAAQYYGRGLTLVASICESLQILPPGNRVQVQFPWSYEE